LPHGIDEVKPPRIDVARVASITEVLRAETIAFKAKLGASGTVMPLSPSSSFELVELGRRVLHRATTKSLETAGAVGARPRAGL
jgi:hypothetical protein